ncbi:MAG: hypothetical protein R3F56_16325 [Planctomycetota bacterium]
MRHVVAATALCAWLTAQPTVGEDGGRTERVRAELRGFYAALYAAERGAPLFSGDGTAEWHRRRLLRAWPRGAAGDAWLRDVARLRRVFDGTFVYGAPDAAAFAALGGIEVHVPSGYSPDLPSPATVEVWPGLGRAGEAWPGRDGRRIVVRATPERLHWLMRPARRMTLREVGERTLLRLAQGTALGGLARRLWVWRVRQEEPLDEERVQKGLFFVIGVVQRQLNVDRDRLSLAGHGSECGTVLRAATAAPDRFSALALSEPDATPPLAYENLAGVPVLMLSTESGIDIVQTLRREIARADVGRVETRDVRRFGAAQIGNWLERQQRRLMRETVTLVMRPDGIVDGYWVAGISADLGGPDNGEPARIRVVADRSRGLITVNARRIERFSLLLNDELIDLDREFTLDVNDVRVTLRRGRSLSFLTQTVSERFDPRFLFTTALSIDVPRGT